MYLDLLRSLTINKRLLQIVGVEPTVYFAEISEILRPVFKKKTYDDNGFFTIDRKYVKDEINLDVEKQVEFDDMFKRLGIISVDPNDINRIAVNMQNLIAIISNDSVEELEKIKEIASKNTRKGKAAAKDAGIKFNMKNLVVESDMELKKAYDRWVESMIDANSCRFTRAVISLFMETLEKYTSDKKAKLRIIEIATINSYKDVSWAINKYEQERNPRGKSYANSQSIATDFGEQKVATNIDETIVF